ncbi:MAG TPA: DUF6709 family protein [Bryobacteraceae bacterium]|nr:DUF6709 family protein [Bryobacteraceae bacterium]
MWDNVVGRHIRRCNRNLLLLNAAILGALGLLAFWNSRYLLNCFQGPFPIKFETLSKITDPQKEAHYYVSVDNLSLVETGLQSVEKNVNKSTYEVKSEKVTATFFLAKGSRPLIIKSTSESGAKHYAGALVPIPNDVRAYFQKELLDERHMQFDDVFAPFMLDATDFKGDAYIGLGICIPIGLLAAWNVRKAVARIQNVQNSPIYKGLNHYEQPPELAAHAIDEEFKNYKNRSPISSITLLPSWLLHKSFFHFTAMHLNEIVWVYQKVTRRSVNSIPVGKTFAIVVYDANGRVVEVDAGRGSEKVASSFVAILQKCIPWAVFGYSDELKDRYKKSRSDFAEAVRARYIEYSNKAASRGAQA